MQAQRMFDDHMYTRLLAIIGLEIKQTVTTSDNCEAEFVSFFLWPFSPLLFYVILWFLFSIFRPFFLDLWNF